MMRRKLFSLTLLLVLGLQVLAQNPQEIHQQDPGHTSIWTSPEALITAVIVIVGILLAKRWSKKIHDKRDEVIRKDEEDNK